MKINFFFTKLFLIFLFLTSNAQANKLSYFLEAKKLFEKNNFEKSRFLFEKDIVFNPKNEISYLYLAKIFNKNEFFVVEPQQKQQAKLKSLKINVFSKINVSWINGCNPAPHSISHMRLRGLELVNVLR